MNAETSSLWSVDHPTRSADRLTDNAICDVCVVGAGIAGLTTAYLLARAGERVVVLDAKPQIAAGETEYTTAHLAWYLDDSYSHLASVRGDDVAKAAAASHRGAIELIEEIVRTEKIACDFHRVFGHLFPGADGPDRLNKEEKTLTRLGLPYERTKLAFPVRPRVDCLRFPDHGQFHPLKYLSALAAAIRKHGGVIHANTVVAKVRGGKPAAVTTTHDNTITARAVVIATNNPFEGGTILHTKVAAYITYAFAAEVPTGSVPRRVVLGHGGPVSLRPHATGRERQELRLSDRRRRGPQDRPGERPAGAVGPA